MDKKQREKERLARKEMSVDMYESNKTIEKILVVADNTLMSQKRSGQKSLMCAFVSVCFTDNKTTVSSVNHTETRNERPIEVSSFSNIIELF